MLKDTHGKLVNAQEGKTTAMRQWRFTSIHDIDESIIKKYILEAIQNQQQGKVIKQQKKPLIIPDDLQKQLDINTVLKEKFESLSLSCKREYAAYISEAKRETTKQKRLEKIIPMIIKRVGLHDKYKKC